MNLDLTQPIHDVRTTLRHFFSVLTSFQRPYNVVLTCVNWEYCKSHIIQKNLCTMAGADSRYYVKSLNYPDFPGFSRSDPDFMRNFPDIDNLLG